MQTFFKIGDPFRFKELGLCFYFGNMITSMYVHMYSLNFGVEEKDILSQMYPWYFIIDL